MSLTELLHGISQGIGLIGVAIITWGVAKATVAIVRIEVISLRRLHLQASRLLLRQQLGSSLLLGLEFLIAADVIRTMLQPTLQEIGVLGGIVAVRTVIGYFLHKEMKEDRQLLAEARHNSQTSDSEP